MCIRYCLVKILQWLQSGFAYWMQYCALICPAIMPTDLENADVAHFAVGASKTHESGAFTPERAGAHLLLLFSEAPIRVDLLWERGLLKHWVPMQIESVASCLLDFKDLQAHDATRWGGWLHGPHLVHFMDADFFKDVVSKLIMIVHFVWWWFSWKRFWIGDLRTV